MKLAAGAAANQLPELTASWTVVVTECVPLEAVMTYDANGVIAVGVPVISPVRPDNVNPAGSC